MDEWKEGGGANYQAARGVIVNALWNKPEVIILRVCFGPFVACNVCPDLVG